MSTNNTIVFLNQIKFQLNLEFFPSNTHTLDGEFTNILYTLKGTRQ